MGLPRCARPPQDKGWITSSIRGTTVRRPPQRGRATLGRGRRPRQHSLPAAAGTASRPMARAREGELENDDRIARRGGRREGVLPADPPIAFAVLAIAFFGFLLLVTFAFRSVAHRH